MGGRVLRRTGGAGIFIGNATTSGESPPAGLIKSEPRFLKGCAMCYADVYRDDTGTVGPFVAGCYCGWSDNGHPTMESAERAAERHEQNATD
jgi:hypothetical protein